VGGASRAARPIRVGRRAWAKSLATGRKKAGAAYLEKASVPLLYEIAEFRGNTMEVITKKTLVLIRRAD